MKGYLTVVACVHVVILAIWTLAYVFQDNKQKNFMEWLFFIHLCLILLVLGAVV